jgi:hypothetical protein
LNQDIHIPHDLPPERRLKGLEEFTDAQAWNVYRNEEAKRAFPSFRRNRDARQFADNRASRIYRPRRQADRSINWSLLFSGLLLGVFAGLIMVVRDDPGIIGTSELPSIRRSKSFGGGRSLPGVTYSGCNEVRAAGRAPLYRGEAGYSEQMDGDDDGIACEPYPGMDVGF